MTNPTLLFTLRPPDPSRDFETIAALLAAAHIQETTAERLAHWHQKQTESGTGFVSVADDPAGGLAGFSWLELNGDPADHVWQFDLAVSPAHQRQGLGSQLYAALEEQARTAGALKLYAVVQDNDPASLDFALHRGFTQRSHGISMALNLAGFPFGDYDAPRTALEAQDFRFTNMAELGNTEDAQRKLYDLNNRTTITTPGTDGRSPWENFEDFQSSVCQSEWYRPDGQFVAIDTQTGAWAGMSAITRFSGADYAYNLFTGVDIPYRGRKLGQAVKVLALHYAAEVLGVTEVRTDHNSLNAPMIAIDRKFGYVQTSGKYGLTKIM